MRKLIFLLLLLLIATPCFGSGMIQGVVGGQIASTADTTPPTLSTATIGTNGTTWTFVFSETVSVGAGGSAGWAVTMSTAGAETLTYSSGSGSNTLVYTGNVTVYSGETVSSGLNYTQPGNGIEDSSGNDLATLSSHSVTNNSTQSASDDCSGDLMWSAHFEGTGAVGTTFDVTTGTPAGCVDTAGDRIITYYSDMVNSTTQKTDGSYSIYRAGASDYAQAPFTGFNTAGMSISFDIYVHTFNSNNNIIQLRDGTAANAFYVYMVDSTGDKFGVAHIGNSGTHVKVDTNTFSTDTWYTIHAQFQTASSPYLRIKVSANAPNTGTTALTAMNGTPNALRFGYNTTGTSVYYVDNVHIYTGWQTGAAWGD